MKSLHSGYGQHAETSKYTEINEELRAPDFEKITDPTGSCNIRYSVEKSAPK